MKMKLFASPFIIASQVTPGEQPDPGLGSGQTTIDEEPWDWEMWQVMYDEDDSDGDGTPGTYSDYVAWMTARHFEDYITPEG